MSVSTEEQLTLFLAEMYGQEKLSTWKERWYQSMSDILSTVGRRLHFCAEEAQQAGDTDRLQSINDMLELPSETFKQVIFDALKHAHSTRKVVMT